MFLNLETITPASGEPLSLARAKSHLRVTFTDDDTDIGEYIETARLAAENWLRRPIRSAGYRATFAEFSVPFVISGLGPLSVTAIDYLDASSVRQTVPAADYFSGHDYRGQVICPREEGWPTNTLAEPLPRITFTVGFATVPAPIVHAIKLYTSFLYNNRDAAVLSSQRFEDNQAWQNLLQPYQIMSI